MSKLENISALLVATDSTFTKEAAFTTKTTRAELIRMLQAADSAVSVALETLERNKEYCCTEMQKLNDTIKQLENKLEQEAITVERLTESEYSLKGENKTLLQKYSELEAKLVTTDQQLADCLLKNKGLEFQVSEQQEKLVATNKELADSKHYAATLQHQVHKYKQQGFFARLFGRTPE